MERVEIEELTSDELLEAYDETVLEDVLAEKAEATISSSDVTKVSTGLQMQSLYLKLINEKDESKKHLFATQLSTLVGESFKERTKSWSSKDRENRYTQQERHYTHKEFNPF